MFSPLILYFFTVSLIEHKGVRKSEVHELKMIKKRVLSLLLMTQAVASAFQPISIIKFTLDNYDQALITSTILTKSCTSALGFCLGDLVAQHQHQLNLKTTKEINSKRLLEITVFGFLFVRKIILIYQILFHLFMLCLRTSSMDRSAISYSTFWKKLYVVNQWVR